MVQVIAHRGARSLAPENTLAAAGLAADLGADLWETDVQQTRDGHLVLCHDRTFERCTNIQLQFTGRVDTPVHLFDLADIQCLDAGSFFADTDPFGQIEKGRVPEDRLKQYAGEPVPTLDKALEFTKHRSWKINLELKHYPGPDTCLPEKTLEAIDRSGLAKGRVVISSFFHPWLDRVRSLDPAIGAQALVGENEDVTLDFEDFRFDTYNVNADLVTPELIADLKKRGKTANLFTVNDPHAFDAFVRMGVDGIFTDFPQRFSNRTVLPVSGKK